LLYVVRTFFDGSAEAAAVAMLRISDGDLSADGVGRLTERIRRARREGR
jgi:hypothetical protein